MIDALEHLVKRSSGFYIDKILFNKGDDVMNNPLLISIAMKRGRPWRKNHTFKPFKVVVKSQHDYGPPYEKREFEQAQRLFDSKSRKIK